jgi:hypothetical protein
MVRPYVRRGSLVAIAGVLLVAQTQPASATVTVSGTEIVGDAGSDVVVVECRSGRLAVRDVVGTGAECEWLMDFSVDPGFNHDAVDVSGVTAVDFPRLTEINIHVTDDQMGNETVTGSPFRDVIHADSHDRLSGGAGDDVIHGGREAYGGLGDDELHAAYVWMGGDEGDDLILGLPGLPGGLSGGPGFDTWEYESAHGPQSIEVKEDRLVLDGRAGFGEPVGFSGVELIKLTFLGDAGRTYDGTLYSGMSRVRGGSDDDTLTGGRRGDVLSGLGGADTITGSGGPDWLEGGEGDDTIDARDGEVDDVDCGQGLDHVVADATDRLADCESVEIPPAVTSAAPTATPPPTPTTLLVIPETGRVTGRTTWIKPAVARFSVSSPAEGASFRCKVDRRRWKSCSSRPKVRTSGLRVGKHVLRVRAVVAGTVDPTPSAKRFEVTRSG